MFSLRSATLVLVLSGLLAGCMAPHAWQTPREMSAVLTEAKQWPQLTTNLYARVEQDKMPEAVSMLQDSAWRGIGTDQVAAFTPTLSQPADDTRHSAFSVLTVSEGLDQIRGPPQRFFQKPQPESLPHLQAAIKNDKWTRNVMELR